MFITILCISVLMLVIVYWCILYYHYFNGMWSMSTPKYLLPLIGHLIYCTNPQNAYWDLHRVLLNVSDYKITRGVVGFYFGVAVLDPVRLEFLMNSPFTVNKASIYVYARRWLGTGLLTSDFKKWRGRRKLLTPAYHFKILEQFIDVFDKNSKILVKKLQKEINKEKTNIYPFVTLCTLDIICETAMGTSVNAQDHSESDYVDAIKNVSNIFVRRAINIFKQSDFLYQFTRDYHKENKYLGIIHDYTMSVIQSRRAKLLQQENVGYKRKMPFIDILLQATYNGTPLKDEDIREEVDTFMFEGHDTTSAAISFCIYNIAQYPGIQTKLLDEQRDIFGSDPGRETTYQDLQLMKYLEMVIKETLRLYPSVPVFARTVSEDFTYDNHTFKKGMEVLISVYSLHRNPAIYPNPEVFNPERFTPEEQAKRHPYAYLPFSAGFRNCIGQKFAMLEMKSTIGMLLRKFVFHQALNFKLQLKSGLIINSANGIHIKITERLW